jgi:DNA-binding winged helix-turn-helix (wHTH) protein/TolB-like protein
LETANGNKNGHSANGHRIAFDNFEVDPANRLLLRDGVIVPLTGKVFDVLLVFTENPGRLLSKVELIEKVWPGSFVEEGNLARNISTLRKALRDEAKPHKFIVTVPAIGYRFVADVAKLNGNEMTESAKGASSFSQTEKAPFRAGAKNFPRKWLWAIPLAVLLITAVLIGKERFFTSSTQLRSLAVLPLRSLDSGQNYLGVGIADAVIRRVSQTGDLTVRPLSAVRHYLDDETDALTAGRQLETDAVLEGSVQRSDDRLRVSINLLRTSDGASLWSDSFDMRSSDIFVIQDAVAQQVVTRLRPKLEVTQRPGTNKQYTSYALAYDFYVKGIYNLDARGYRGSAKPQMDVTIEFFKKAIEADPNYALAHSKLAYAYVWMAMFIEPTEPKWAELAKTEIERSQAIDPQLAENHVAKSLLLWSSYEGYQNDAAIRELLAAQKLNPDVGHIDLAAIYLHVGLDDLASLELERSIEIDPTGHNNTDLILMSFALPAKPDEWFAASQKLNPGAPSSPWYLLRKGRLAEAKEMIDSIEARSPNDSELLDDKALLFALNGDYTAVSGQISGILAKSSVNDPSRHHSTYDLACIYAIEGNSGEAVKWLKETAASGFPNYPLFERDAYLDRIRQSPEFVLFIADQKAKWEERNQEFGGYRIQ